MILNIIFVVLGLISLLLGIKNKLRLWIVAGVILLGAGVISGVIDYKTAGIGGGVNGGRLPMVISNTVN